MKPVRTKKGSGVQKHLCVTVTNTWEMLTISAVTKYLKERKKERE
jgi:hypothetical protein